MTNFSKMFRLFLIAFTLVMLLVGFLYWRADQKINNPDEANVAEGKDLFALHCLSCHGLQQDGIGPPLGGVTRVRSGEELKSFIRNPAEAIATGDIRGQQLIARYKQTMPSFDWLDTGALEAILSYLRQETDVHGIQGFNPVQTAGGPEALSGRIVKPIVKSGVRISLDEIIRIPRLSYSTPDLGIATLRPHPSGDGRLFVSDQGGILYQVNGKKAEIFIDLRAHIKDFSIGPGLATGLGSFDFHPDFVNNGLIYITHAEKYNGQTADYVSSDSVLAEVQWVLGEWKMHDVADRTFQGSYRELMRLHAPTFGHGAQDLAFTPDLPVQHPEWGLLYWGFGDGGSNNIKRPELGHNRRSFLGTILRIDPAGNDSRNGKYGIPPGNPFAGDHDPNTVKEIFAYGFRNPHRIAWDVSNNHRMMVTDIGESNIEEINIVEKGGDYGWPSREGTFGITTLQDLKSVYRLPDGDDDLYKKPFAQYDHTDGFAISGGYVYEGDIEDLRNKYIFGDIVNGRLLYVNVDPQLSDSTIYELSIIQNEKETDLRAMTGIRRLHLRVAYDRFAKALYVITKADGRIYSVIQP